LGPVWAAVGIAGPDQRLLPVLSAGGGDLAVVPAAHAGAVPIGARRSFRPALRAGGFALGDAQLPGHGQVYFPAQRFRRRALHGQPPGLGGPVHVLGPSRVEQTRDGALRPARRAGLCGGEAEHRAPMDAGKSRPLCRADFQTRRLLLVWHSGTGTSCPAFWHWFPPRPVFCCRPAGLLGIVAGVPPPAARRLAVCRAVPVFPPGVLHHPLPSPLPAPHHSGDASAGGVPAAQLLERGAALFALRRAQEDLRFPACSRARRRRARGRKPGGNLTSLSTTEDTEHREEEHQKVSTTQRRCPARRRLPPLGKLHEPRPFVVELFLNSFPLYSLCPLW